MDSPARTAPGELAIRLAVMLAVQDVRAQRGGIELRGDGRQALIIDGRGHHPTLRAVKPFAQPDVIRVIIFHARRSLQTATAADDPVASPARTGAARISFESRPRIKTFPREMKENQTGL